MTMKMRASQAGPEEAVAPVSTAKELPAPTAKEMGFDMEPFRLGMLSITIMGASGDLAKKETYPALLDLYAHDYLPKGVAIVGFARTVQDNQKFRDWLKPWLLKCHACQTMKKCRDAVDDFLQICTYFAGGYGSEEDLKRLNQTLLQEERSYFEKNKIELPKTTNRVFYFAIPPFVFAQAAKAVKLGARAPGDGFTRMIVEKPFGSDLNSAKELSDQLGELYPESDLFRMDHFLGYEINQSILFLRFGNAWLEPMMNNQHVASVRVSLKEAFGTSGRGGYFTKYGIIRDVIQNHLLQVLCLMAMDKPSNIGGDIRDAKVAVLNSMLDFNPDDVVLGQFTENNGNPGFLQDDSIAAEDREIAKYCSTFCQMVLYIDNDRWRGVPFIIRAGKGLEESKCEVRVQFKSNHSDYRIFKGQPCARNELVLRVHPNEAVWLRTNVKAPGLHAKLQQSELDLSYGSRYEGAYLPEAYTRLILAGIRGESENFVRSDELLQSWRLFTPLLEKIEMGKKEVIKYPFGSRGPPLADEMLPMFNVVRQEGYDLAA